MSRRKKQGEQEIIVIRPIWWRQLAFTLFLFLMGFFFAAFDFGMEILNHGLMAVFGVVAMLNLLDQLFVWSRLRIDANTYSLRSWFRRIELRQDEVESFIFSEYMRRQLIVVKLTDSAATERGLSKPEMPFPCAFGRPADEVLETLRGTLPEGSSMLE